MSNSIYNVDKSLWKKQVLTISTNQNDTSRGKALMNENIESGCWTIQPESEKVFEQFIKWKMNVYNFIGFENQQVNFTVVCSSVLVLFNLKH